ncbi:MAG: putative Ribokinase [Parcubacteria group bacterium Greene0714_21]|nr:MAG: putative Ribokinase [Parcubacteria group bacterium Greene0416_39]TSC97476.1 MAG: putative Ribokinase [Parcubacteria group bacterium Greene1014_47]TSD04431.1 MAG: putative Ribokinase [Parcubacteria group bacterium Greene0714_21]
MKPKFDLISVGDTQYDVFLELEEETKILRDEQEQRDYLGLVFAEKIPVQSYTAVPAVGNSVNVAIGASRLGLKTALYTVLGDDRVGKEELEIFKKEKVSTDYIAWDKKRGSNFSAVLNYKGERTILVFHEPRDYNLPKLAPARFLYYSSLAKDHEKLHTQIPSYIKKSGAKLVFNPGSHQLKEGLSVLQPILQVTSVFLVNKEEAQELLGTTEQDVKILLELLSRCAGSREAGQGPEIVVITDDGKGSHCFDGTNFYHLDIFRVPVKEMTGAGDAYSTGFVSALAYGNNVKEAMRWGAVNGASVIQKIGAREGLLRKDEMEKMLQENPGFQPIII